jgi:DNA repair exonuclease SbcCD ATPase subunit
VERELAGLEREESELRSTRSDHTETVASLRAEVLEYQRKHEAAELRFYDAVTNVDLAKDWPQRFKELRLWLIDEALDELSVHVNSSLIELGLAEWSIEFVVEKETARGNIARGFDLLVRSPNSPDGVPWEGWSGGETQRLRIACAVGFANLIRSRMPSSPEFEVWDEPTAHLNTTGVEDLVAFMAHRAEHRQIWMVDHRALDSGAFTETLTVVKDHDGSRVERDES